MYKIWYDYVKPKYGETKQCFMDRDSLKFYMKAQDIYSDIAKDVEVRFDTANYESNWHFPKEKKKKSHSYLADNSSEGKKAKNTKKCVIKEKPKFEDYKNYLEANNIENRKIV